MKTTYFPEKLYAYDTDGAIAYIREDIVDKMLKDAIAITMKDMNKISSPS